MKIFGKQLRFNIDKLNGKKFRDQIFSIVLKIYITLCFINLSIITYLINVIILRP